MEANLALACMRCNFHKGPNLSGIDPETGDVVRRFNPRSDLWAEHFRWNDLRIEGITPVGRGTVRVLEMNQVLRVEARQRLRDDAGFTIN